LVISVLRGVELNIFEGPIIFRHVGCRSGQSETGYSQFRSMVT